MKKSFIAVCAFAGLLAIPALAHHSSSWHVRPVNKTVVLTGVAYQFVAQANARRAALLRNRSRWQARWKDKDGKNVDWGVEMAEAAAVARSKGHHPSSLFPRRHDFQREANPAATAVISDPASAPAPPSAPGRRASPGKLCDTVQGSEL